VWCPGQNKRIAPLLLVTGWSAGNFYYFLFFYSIYLFYYRYIHRLSINRPTKRGKEKSPSNGHCQYEKEMEEFLKESHIVSRLAKERSSFLKINDISFFGAPGCHHCCSIA
jgi:hypothetical protein